MAMMTNAEIQKAAQDYLSYKQQGMNPADAFKKAFPNGLPTADDRAKAAADQQQKQGFSQVGGMVVGGLTTYDISQIVQGKGEVISKLVDALGPKTGTEIAKAGVSAATQTSTAPALIDAAAPASQATTQAGAAAGAPASGFSLSGVGSAGNFLLPMAGAFGAYDLFSNARHGVPGAAEGALSGAAMGSYFGPPGALVGALLGGGVGYFGNFGDKDRWKEEQSARQKLADQGVTGWGDLNATMPKLSRGRSVEELQAIDAQNQAAGKWANPAFTTSRDESQLKPEDIWGYSAFGQHYGNDWFGKFDENQRRQIAQQALDAGAVQEAKGQINVDWSKMPGAAAPAASGSPLAQALVRRSMTRSPGIGLDGRPMRY